MRANDRSADNLGGHLEQTNEQTLIEFLNKYVSHTEDRRIDIQNKFKSQIYCFIQNDLPVPPP